MAGGYPCTGRALFVGQSGGRRVIFFCTGDGYGIQCGADVVDRWAVEDVTAAVAAAIAAFLASVDRPGAQAAPGAPARRERGGFIR